MSGFVWSAHALYQLQERKISKRVVLAAFQKPDKITQQSSTRFQLVKIIHRKRKRYLLVVIFDKRNQRKEIVTVFITSKVHKYL